MIVTEATDDRHPEGWLGIDDHGRIALTQQGQPVITEKPVTTPEISAIIRLSDRSPVTAYRASAADVEKLGEVVDTRRYSRDPLVARAVAMLKNREHLRFDPADGSEVHFDADGRVATGSRGEEIFPRLDPCVIGLITLAGADRVLVAENALHKGFFALVAGHVELGENLEEAFIREAMEETGRRVEHVTYRGSQSWPSGGALMLGVTATTSDEEPVAATDGELSQSKWVNREELEALRTPPPGSIAHDLLAGYLNGELGQSTPTTP